MKFLSPEVALYLYKCTIWSYMECSCHVLVGAVSCCWELLEMLQKQLQYVVLLVLHLLPPLNPWHIVEMKPSQVFSIGITLIDVHVNWFNCFHFLILKGGLLIILIHYMNFLHLGWCPQLLLGFVRQATKMDMQDCWSFTCCFS